MDTVNIHAIQKARIFPCAESARKKGLPKAFQKFKNVRVVIEGFEIGIQRSKDYRQQGNTQVINHITL